MVPLFSFHTQYKKQDAQLRMHAVNLSVFEWINKGIWFLSRQGMLDEKILASNLIKMHSFFVITSI